MKITLLFIGLCVLTSQAFPQSAEPEPQIQQKILEELRAIHRDLRLSQTTQVLLTEWQFQQATVSNTLRRRDTLRNDLADTQSAEVTAKADIARNEDEMSQPGLSPEEKKDHEQQHAHLASTSIELKAREERIANDLQETELRLRNEQSTLDGIQAQLSDVMKTLR